jgi:hypothetical protein
MWKLSLTIKHGIPPRPTQFYEFKFKKANKQTKIHTLHVKRAIFSQKQMWAITGFHIEDTIFCLVFTELICYAFNCREISTKNSVKQWLLKGKLWDNVMTLLASNYLTRWRNSYLRYKTLTCVIYYIFFLTNKNIKLISIHILSQ